MNVELKRIRTEAETAVLEAFVDAQDTLPGKAETMAERRRRMALFERDGLPHRRIEAWKYTDLRTLMRAVAPLAEAPTPVDAPKALLDGAAQIVIADGHLVRADNLPQGVSLQPLRTALAEGTVSLGGADTPDRAIDALNAAFVRDGVVLSVTGDAAIGTPLELVFLRGDTETMSHARVEVALADGASARIIERHVSPDGVASQSSAVTRYTLGQGATLDVLRFQMEGDAAAHLGEGHARPGRWGRSQGAAHRCRRQAVAAAKREPSSTVKTPGLMCPASPWWPTASTPI